MRDALDLKRMMITVVVALIPCVLMAVYNTGYQANYWIGQGAAPLHNWQEAVYAAIGLGYDSSSHLANLLHGAVYFLPIFAMTFIIGGHIEVAVAIMRKHEVNEGFLVTGFLFPLTLPPTIPLWQVAMGIAFGVIIGKEIFGGTGMNVLNPALTARAFLFFAYPAQISGTSPGSQPTCRRWPTGHPAPPCSLRLLFLAAMCLLSMASVATSGWIHSSG